MGRYTGSSRSSFQRHLLNSRAETSRDVRPRQSTSWLRGLVSSVRAGRTSAAARSVLVASVPCAAYRPTLELLCRSVFGDTAVVGAYNDGDNGSRSGSAYVFRYDGSDWVEEAKLTASDGAAYDRLRHLGRRLRRHGRGRGPMATTTTGRTPARPTSSATTGAIGSRRRSSRPRTARRPTASAGRSPSPATRPWSGPMVTMATTGRRTPARPTSSATTGATGSRRRSSRPRTARRTTASASRSPSPATRPWSGPWRRRQRGSNSGSAYVFRYDGSDWVEEAKLTASDGAADDYFGISVAVSGDTAVVGAFDFERRNGSSSGSAYVFRYDGSDWVEEAKLTASRRR